MVPPGAADKDMIGAETHNENQRLDQVIKQLVKLEDVLELRRGETDQEIFQRMETLFQEAPGNALWRKPQGSFAGRGVFRPTEFT